MLKEWIGYKIGDRVKIGFDGFEVSGVLIEIKDGNKKGLGFSKIAVIDCDGDVLTVPFCCVFKNWGAL